MNLLDYIEGLRKGKEANRFEKEAMKDPFLADALDGFDLIEGNHYAKIKKLQRRVAVRTNNSPDKKWILSIAAGILIVISVGIYFLIPEDDKSYFADNNEELIALSNESAIEEFILYRPAKREIITETEKKDKIKPEEKSIVTPFQNERIVEVELKDHVELLAAASKKESDLSNKQFERSSEDKSSDVQKKASVVEKSEPLIGSAEYNKYLKTSIVKPTFGDCAGLKGKVIVQFNITPEGQPTNIKILKGLCVDSDMEAIRLVKSGSYWKYTDNDPVSVEIEF
jgi:hypothetical protein